MPSRAVVLPVEDGVDALRRRLAVLTARGPTLVVACRGPVGSLQEVVATGVDLENLIVFDAKQLEGADGVPRLDPAVYSFGAAGAMERPHGMRATILIDDLPSLFALPDPQHILSLVRDLRDAIFPAGADVEYVSPPGQVPPPAWVAIVDSFDEVLPLRPDGRLDRLAAANGPPA
jgi:hypothetical protein